MEWHVEERSVLGNIGMAVMASVDQRAMTACEYLGPIVHIWNKPRAQHHCLWY